VSGMSASRDAARASRDRRPQQAESADPAQTWQRNVGNPRLSATTGYWGAADAPRECSKPRS